MKMRQFFENLEKLKIKLPVDGGKEFSFIRVDSSHYNFLLEFFKNNRGQYDSSVLTLKNLLDQNGGKRRIYNIALLADGRIIGFRSYTVFPGHYVWVRGLTVDTHFRKLGWGTRLHEIGVEIALKNNLNTIRGAVVSHNIPMFEKWGYDKLQSWHIWTCKMDRSKSGNSDFSSVVLADSADIEKLEKFLHKSSHYASSYQMYAEDLTWCPLDIPSLGDLIKDGRVFLNKYGAEIRGLAIFNRKSSINPFADGNFSVMEIGYFDRDWLAILDFIREKYHPGFIRIYSPNRAPLECLPAKMKESYFLLLRDLSSGKIDDSIRRLLIPPFTLVQKRINS